MCVWRYSVSQVALGCLVVEDVPPRSQSSPLGGLLTKCQYVHPHCSKRTIWWSFQEQFRHCGFQGCHAFIWGNAGEEDYYWINMTFNTKWRELTMLSPSHQEVHAHTRPRNAVSRSTNKQLWIGDRKTEWIIRFAKRCPEAVDVTVHEKGRCVEAMREESAVWGTPAQRK